MRYRLALLVVVFAASGCSLGLDVPSGTAIECASQSDCPDGYVCQTSLSRCVPIGYDVTPPALIAPPLITPSIVGANAVVEISFTTSKTLGLDPQVTLVFGPTVQRSAQLISSANDETDFVYAYTPDLSEPQTQASVVILITDIAGNQGSSESPTALRFDFEAPMILPGTAVLSLAPPPGSILASATALTVGGVATLDFWTSEPIADATRVIVDGGDVVFTRESVLGNAYSYRAAYAGGVAEGPHAVSLEAVDAAGNSTVTELGDLVIDSIAPAPPLTTTQDAVLYRRAPWQADATTRFTVRGIAGAFEPGATVAVFDRPASDAAAQLLNSARADSTGALATLILPQVDRQLVYVEVVDDAGNRSPRQLVQDVDWVGGFDPQGFASPHQVHAFRNLRRGLDTGGAIRLLGDTLADLGAQDESNWFTYELQRAWHKAPTPPRQNGRYFAAAAYDARHEQVVFFGGILSSASTAFGSQELSLWNGEWTNPTPLGGLPPPRFGHAMAYDPLRERVVLYGGQNVETVYDDTWEWDGERWVRLDIGGPGGMTFHAMAYDPATSRIVMFGGCHDGVCSDMSNETWSFDGDTWAPLTTNTPPAARAGHSLTYYNGDIVLFGGCLANSDFTPGTGDAECDAYQRDRWSLAGATWANISDNSEPTGRAFHAAVWDDADNLYIYGGGPVARSDLVPSHVWASDGGGFFQIYDSGVQATGVTGAYHVAKHRVVVFGGLYDADMDLGINDQLYSLNGSALGLAVSEVTPAIRVLGGLSYMPNRGALVQSGGGTVIGEDRESSMSWDGYAWSSISGNIPDTTTAQCADARGGGVTVYDSVRGRLVSVCGNRTFELTGAGAWTEVCTLAGCRGTLPTPDGTTGAGTGGYALTYDSSAQRSLLFGGGIVSGANGGVSNNLFAYSGTSWTTLCASGSLVCTPPPARRCAGMAYDAARNRTVMFGGGDEFCDDVFDGDGSGNPRNDTWEWNGSGAPAKWSQVCTSNCTPPPPRANASLVYDSVRARVTMVGPGYGDIWEWTGTTWREGQTEGVKPTARRASALGYDPGRRVIALFGGRGGNDPMSDLWELDVDPEQRPAVLLDFDWSAAGVGRTSVRSVTIHARAGGTGATVDAALAPDGDTLGDVRNGVQIEFWRPESDWLGFVSNTAGAGAPSDISLTRTSNCGGELLKLDNHIYARLSPVFGDGNGAEAARISVDTADVTVRYTIGLDACP